MPVYHPELTVGRTPHADRHRRRPRRRRLAARRTRRQLRRAQPRRPDPAAGRRPRPGSPTTTTTSTSPSSARTIPPLLRASFTERDHIWNDDYVMLLLDTYGEQTWAYEIAANPYGVQGDLLWSTNGDEDMTLRPGLHARPRASPRRAGRWRWRSPGRACASPTATAQAWRVDFWRNRPREAREQSSWAAYDRDESCWPCRGAR